MYSFGNSVSQSALKIRFEEDIPDCDIDTVSFADCDHLFAAPDGTRLTNIPSCWAWYEEHGDTSTVETKRFEEHGDKSTVETKRYEEHGDKSTGETKRIKKHGDMSTVETKRYEEHWT